MPITLSPTRIFTAPQGRGVPYVTAVATASPRQKVRGGDDRAVAVGGDNVGATGAFAAPPQPANAASDAMTTQQSDVCLALIIDWTYCVSGSLYGSKTGPTSSEQGRSDGMRNDTSSYARGVARRTLAPDCQSAGSRLSFRGTRIARFRSGKR